MEKTNEMKGFTTLKSRVRWIIGEKRIKQTEFARALGISANYVYLLTSGRKTAISEPLAKLIESTYGYCAEWVRTGKGRREHNIPLLDLQRDTIRKVKEMNAAQLQAVADFIKEL